METAGTAADGALLVAALVLVPGFYVNLLAYVGLYSLVAVGLVLLTGVAGVTSFGQAAFVGNAAYTTAVLGGAGYVWGAVLGAGVITLLRHWLQDFLPALLGRSGNFETVVLGAILMLVLHRARNGIAPALAKYIRTSPKSPPEGLTRLMPRRESPSTGTPLLELDGVTRRFGGLVAVNNLSFELQEGEILGLIGPNGAGKSTTFNLITNVTAPSEGQVLYRGRRIDGVGMRGVAQRGIARTCSRICATTC